MPTRGRVAPKLACVLADKLQFTHTIRYENKKISLKNKNLSDIFLMYIY